MVRGWWYSWIFLDGHRLPWKSLPQTRKFCCCYQNGLTWTWLPGKIGGVARSSILILGHFTIEIEGHLALKRPRDVLNILERSPGCGRERARSSQSESARRPEAVELQATQSNPWKKNKEFFIWSLFIYYILL